MCNLNLTPISLCNSAFAYVNIVLCPGGGYSHRNAIADVPPKWVGFDKKSLNIGPIFGPKIPKHVSIFLNIFWIFLKKLPVFGAKSLNMCPFLEQNP